MWKTFSDRLADVLPRDCTPGWAYYRTCIAVCGNSGAARRSSFDSIVGSPRRLLLRDARNTSSDI